MDSQIGSLPQALWILLSISVGRESNLSLSFAVSNLLLIYGSSKSQCTSSAPWAPWVTQENPTPLSIWSWPREEAGAPHLHGWIEASLKWWFSKGLLYISHVCVSNLTWCWPTGCLYVDIHCASGRSVTSDCSKMHSCFADGWKIPEQVHECDTEA